MKTTSDNACAVARLAVLRQGVGRQGCGRRLGDDLRLGAFGGQPEGVPVVFLEQVRRQDGAARFVLDLGADVVHALDAERAVELRRVEGHVLKRGLVDEGVELAQHLERLLCQTLVLDHQHRGGMLAVEAVAQGQVGAAD